jgi:3-methylfumaryl-CoA hydratase
MTIAEETITAGQSETLSLAQARRVAAMLDIDPQRLAIGDALPRGWHFALLAGETPRRDLRSDGFPGLGVPMPQLDRPRLLLGQRSMTFQGDLSIGAVVLRRSAIASIIEKSGRNGPLSIVNIEHSLTPAGTLAPAVIESQTYYLAGLPPVASAKPAPAAAANPVAPDLPTGSVTKIVTPDDLMLFQYSALGFNTHRIHFDRDYARQVEGHPDLVVNGGLATLLATEYLRTDLRLAPKTLTARHLAPLYANRPITIHVETSAVREGKILLLDGDGIIAAELAGTFDEL